MSLKLWSVSSTENKKKMSWCVNTTRRTNKNRETFPVAAASGTEILVRSLSYAESLIKRGQKKTHNGVTYVKPTSPNRNLTPNLTAIGSSPRNTILMGQPGLPRSAVGVIWLMYPFRLPKTHRWGSPPLPRPASSGQQKPSILYSSSKIFSIRSMGWCLSHESLNKAC